MELRYEPLCVPFSTADAVFPRIVTEGNSLRVEFQDWCENLVAILFHDVAAYSWDAGEAALDPSHRDDCCYVVSDSPWVKRHFDVGNLMPSEKYQHYKLCFNAAGVLQVLATKLEVLDRRAEVK